MITVQRKHRKHRPTYPKRRAAMLYHQAIANGMSPEHAYQHVSIVLKQPGSDLHVTDIADLSGFDRDRAD